MSENDANLNNEDRVQSFLRLHSASQHRIYGFIMSFVADWNEADDIYQETLGVLWRRFSEYVPGTDFLAWAFRIAHFQILSHLKKKKTHRKHFSQATLENLGEVAMSSVQDSHLSLEALRRCIQKLSERSRRLLSLRYEDGATVASIARQAQLSVNTLYKEYQKVHAQLFRCVRKQIGVE